MERISFECESITPMFMYGADGETPEIREQSIIGAMRFWWRALSIDSDIAVIKNKEAQVFGNADEKIGKSKITIDITNAYIKTNEIGLNLWTDYFSEHIRTANNGKHSFKYNSDDKTERNKIPAIGYLWYSVLLKSQIINNRIKHLKYIKPGKKFGLIFSFNNPTHKNDIFNSLISCSLYGGLGSRSRRGGGNFRIISCTDIEFQNKINSLSEIKVQADLIHSIKSNFPFLVPSISAVHSEFSTLKNANVYIFGSYSNWRDALESIGKNFQSFRITNDSRGNTPYFGLPLKHRGSPSIKATKAGGNHDSISRRSSSIILKVAKFNSIYFPIVVNLGGLFFPNGYSIPHNRETPADKIITDYFSQPFFLGANKIA